MRIILKNIYRGTNEMKFLNKKVLVSIIVILFAVCGALILLLFSYGIVDNNVIKYFDSNGKYKAVLFVRDAGATTGYSYQVSVINKNQNVGKKPGNIFICEYDQWDKTNIDVSWISNNKIQISYFDKGIHIFKNVESIKDVKVEYIKK
jgi:hypothetical protein